MSKQWIQWKFHTGIAGDFLQRDGQSLIHILVVILAACSCNSVTFGHESQSLCNLVMDYNLCAIWAWITIFVRFGHESQSSCDLVMDHNLRAIWSWITVFVRFGKISEVSYFFEFLLNAIQPLKS